MVIFIHFPWHALEEPEDVGLDDNRAFGVAIGQENGHYIVSSWYIVYFMFDEITLTWASNFSANDLLLCLE